MASWSGTNCWKNWCAIIYATLCKPPKSRVLALDYGDTSIGVAVSCPRGVVATGVETIRRADALTMKPVMARLRELISAYGIGEIVLGEPLHMDGSPSPRSEATRDFAERLRRNFKRLTVTLWDERLSTRAVARSIEPGRYAMYVDEMAAVYILQGYLDFRLGQSPIKKERGMNENEFVVMYDDDGNEQAFEVLATREANGITYLLAGEEPNEEDEIEIVHFKCIADGGDEMTFEVVDHAHEDVELVMKLFEDDYKALEIIIEE